MTATTRVGPGRSTRPVAWWLLGCALLIFGMVVLGGVTRLTESGLSIVEWRPVTGVVPPLSEADWQAAFDAYKQFPEYQKLNRDMGLDDFKTIFWFEYAHRLLGRLIGIVFLVPLVVFTAQRRIAGRLVGRLALIFLLGTAQGALGWAMVASGLVDRPDVSQYRLTAHLVLAVVVYGLIVATAVRLFRSSNPWLSPPGFRVATSGFVLLALLMIASGGFVAGLNAGLVYNTFPLMGDRLMPQDALFMRPWWINHFENAAMVQFQHRALALVTAAAAVGLWMRSFRTVEPEARLPFHLLGLMTLLQVGLGIATLVLVVPTPLAALHQAGAVLVFTFAVWARASLAGGVQAGRAASLTRV
jgi:heme a synthase